MAKGLILKKQKILLIFKKLLHVLLRNEVSCCNSVASEFFEIATFSYATYSTEYMIITIFMRNIIMHIHLIQGGGVNAFTSVLRGTLHFVQLCILIKICFRGVIPSKVRLFTNPNFVSRLSVLIILRILIRTFFDKYTNTHSKITNVL